MKKFALFASLFVTSLCFADTNAERTNFDDPEVLKKIIDQAVVLEAVKKADGSLQYFEPLDFAPYQGSGWGVIYYENKNQDSNKKLAALIQFLKGEPEGLVITWYYNGQKQTVESYKDGKLDGLVTLWYENRQKHSVVSYKDGKPEGLSTFWHENGQKKRESDFKDGKLEGLAKEWHANGKKESEINWKSGKQEGLSTVWNANGTKKSEGTLKDGKFEGLSTFWYENGQRKAVFLFSQGKPVNGMGWLPDGQVCPISKIKDGSGVIVNYDIEGKEVSRKKYKAGVEVNDTNEKTKTPFDNSIPLPNLDDVAFPAIFPE